MEFRVLLHETIRAELVEFAASKNEAVVRSLNTQLNKIRASPLTAGSPMRRIIHPSLSGKIYKLWVGGPQGFRLTYFVDQDKKVACPFFISSVPRKDLDWDSVDWQSRADPIHNDLICGNTNAFEVFGPRGGKGTARPSARAGGQPVNESTAERARPSE